MAIDYFSYSGADQRRWELFIATNTKVENSIVQVREGTGIWVSKMSASVRDRNAYLAEDVVEEKATFRGNFDAFKDTGIKKNDTLFIKYGDRIAKWSILTFLPAEVEGYLDIGAVRLEAGILGVSVLPATTARSFSSSFSSSFA